MKRWLIYSVEFALAAVILYILGLYPFLLYTWVIMLWKIDKTTEYFRKLIRCLCITPELKINAIVKKLRITNKEINASVKAARRIMGETRWNELEKEMRELGSS